MSLPATPNPFPTLREGYALGANEHRGFVNVWNWLTGIMRKAKDFFCLGLNDRTGDISVVAGEGIDVTTQGNSIMISLGTGQNVDNDAGGGGGRGGGSGMDGQTGGRSGRWTDSSLPDAPTAPSSQCNDWSVGGGNGWGDEPLNEGDNCAELNGW